MKIVVVGDACVDRYWLATSDRQSAEAPIPVCEIQAKFDLPGGAANVRANLRGLGVDGLILMPGKTQAQNYPIKNRLMVGDHQIARWDENDYTRPFRAEDLDPLREAEAVIVADYGKGSITEEVIQFLRESDFPVFVDTKRDPRPWIGATNVIMFPNLSEYTRYEQGYEWFPKVLLKRGKDGLSWVTYGNLVASVPAKAKFVRSVNGAGDTVIAAFAESFLGGATLERSVKWANAAAAVAVELPYTTAVTRELVEEKFGL